MGIISSTSWIISALFCFQTQKFNLNKIKEFPNNLQRKTIEEGLGVNMTCSGSPTTAVAQAVVLATKKRHRSSLPLPPVKSLCGEPVEVLASAAFHRRDGVGDAEVAYSTGFSLHISAKCLLPWFVPLAPVRVELGQSTWHSVTVQGSL